MAKIVLKKKIYLGLLVLICVLLFMILQKSHKTSQIAVAQSILLNPADVNTALESSLDEVIYFTGDLSPKEQTIISAEVDARIVKVFVDEGQLVKTGQLLAKLDAVDLVQAVNQQEAELASAKAKYELDQQKMNKQQELYKQGFISRLAYDELVTNYQASLQNYKAQQALLNRSKKQLANTQIVAPFSGIIYEKSIEEGQLALKNTKLFSLANLSKLEIKAAIPSYQINRVKLKQEVSFKVETDNRFYQGYISRVNQVAQSGTRSYLVYIDFANKNSLLKAGQFVKGSIVLRHLNKQIVIPCDSIREAESATIHQQYVLALDGNLARQKNIEVVLTNLQTNQCAVKGLTAGEIILSGNVLTVKALDKVKVLK